MKQGIIGVSKNMFFNPLFFLVLTCCLLCGCAATLTTLHCSESRVFIRDLAFIEVYSTTYNIDG